MKTATLSEIEITEVCLIFESKRNHGLHTLKDKQKQAWRSIIQTPDSASDNVITHSFSWVTSFSNNPKIKVKAALGNNKILRSKLNKTKHEVQVQRTTEYC